MTITESVTICGRTFDADDLTSVRSEIDRAIPPLRAEIARRVCRRLDWTDAVGRPKLMSCRVALLKLHRSGLIELPPPRNGNGNGRGLSRQAVEWPVEQALSDSVNNRVGLHLEPVADKQASALWNGLIDRYHYLGYSPLPGAQMRYLIRDREQVLGAIGFGAAAWKVAVRDRWIGWNASTREQRLAQVVNNARFLILPWVQVNNLASKVLSLCSRRIGGDFERRYGIRPVLLESFVDTTRYRGTCYRAANWQYLGDTTGRGKCDRHHRAELARKAVYVYPLVRRFRRTLAGEP